MTEAQKILSLIETVDPSDADKLDEIDARVWCFVNRYNFKNMLNKAYEIMNAPFSYYTLKAISPENKGAKTRVVSSKIKYTRSRDALKSIRPEGWCFRIMNTFQGPATATSQREACGELLQTYEYLPTEELAELHAIIQSIEHETKQGV